MFIDTGSRYGARILVKHGATQTKKHVAYRPFKTPHNLAQRASFSSAFNKRG